VFLLAHAAFYFIPAGTLRAWQGWNYLGIFSFACIATSVYFLKHDPKLIERRLSLAERGEQRPLQKFIQLTLGPAYVFMFVLAGLDRRFGWAPVPDFLALVCNALVGLGLVGYFIVFRENSFASATVETSTEQKVVTTGPYALVRHPMYSAGLLFLFATPMALGSFVAEIFFPVFIALIVLRMQDEEKMLSQKLPGYTEYLQKTRFRLLPGIW
jgi:protein-S-isoprenylcysteine O-methyltransferase Ste14